MKKGLYVYLLIGVSLLTIGPIYCVIGSLLYGGVSSLFYVNEKVYYIPQTKMYVKIIYNSDENAGYIYFNSNNNFDNLESIDNIKLRAKNWDSPIVDIYVLPFAKNKLYIMDKDHLLMDKKSTLYDIEHVMFLG